MIKIWNSKTKSIIDYYLLWSIVEMVISTNYLCKSHKCIIYCNYKIVCRRTISSCNNKVIYFSCCNVNFTFYTIYKRDDTLLWCLNTDNRINTLWWCTCKVSIFSVVSCTLFFSHLLFTECRKLIFTHVALICFTLF